MRLLMTCHWHHMNKWIYFLKVSLYLSVIKYSASSTNMHTIIVNTSSVCVCEREVETCRFVSDKATDHTDTFWRESIRNWMQCICSDVELKASVYPESMYYHHLGGKEEKMLVICEPTCVIQYIYCKISIHTLSLALHLTKSSESE